MLIKIKVFLIFSALTLFCALPLQAKESDATPKEIRMGVYETPTMAKLARLYWGLGKFDKTSAPKVFLDNYLKINECDLFREYGHNELEWNQIRATTYDFLQKNKADFSRHYIILLPLNLSEYDSEKGVFHIAEDKQIKNARSFESRATDFDVEFCGLERSRPIAGYPRSLYIELNRPFNLLSVPMTKEKAEEYIKDKAPKFKRIDERFQSKAALIETRDIYLVMKVRVMNFVDEVRLDNTDYRYAQVMGILDRYEIYQDEDLINLIHAEDMNSKKPISNTEMELRKKYQERLKARMSSQKTEVKNQ